MNNVLKIKSGITKENIHALNTYLNFIESSGVKNSRLLSQILDECPRQLYEPVNIRNQEDERILDLAFIYDNDKIIGHLVHTFIKSKTKFGYRFGKILQEEFYSEEVPDDLIIDYIENRMMGAIETKVFDYEEKNKKQI